MHADEGEAAAGRAAGAAAPWAAAAAAAAAAALPPLQGSDGAGLFPRSGGGGSPGTSGGSGGSGGAGNALLGTPPPAPCSRAEQNVLSPTPSPSATGPPAAHVGCTTGGPDGPQPAHGPAAAPAQQAPSGGGTARLHARAAELQRQVVELMRMHSFVRCLAGSMVLPSALLLLEIGGNHPPVGGGRAGPAGLEWTLAQLMALFVRTGEKAATENMLLAALWVLESAHDSRHSGATAVLGRYVKLIGVWFPQAARLLRIHWPAAFEAMRAQLVASQMRLLTCLGWRVHLTHETDVQPCHRLLFAGDTTPVAEAGQPGDGSCTEAAAVADNADGRRPAAASGAKPMDGSRPAAAAAPLDDSVRTAGGQGSSRAVAAARQMARAYQRTVSDGTPAGMAGSCCCSGPTLDDLEALLAANRATLRASVHSMLSTLKEQAARLRRALLHHAAKHGLRRPASSEPAAKRRRLE